MITAVDTNVIVALWGRDLGLSTGAQKSLEDAAAIGELVVPPPVYAELLSCPGRNELFLEEFCRDTGITVDWEITREIWIAAGQAFQKYAVRRKAHSVSGPRRILADFLIGAYAMEKAGRLITLDRGIYRAAFPALQLESF